MPPAGSQPWRHQRLLGAIVFLIINTSYVHSTVRRLLQVTEDLRAALAALPACFPNLQSLALGDAATDEALQSAAQHLPRLTDLRLVFCDRLTDDGLVSALRCFTALTRLDLTGTRVANAGLAQVLRLPQLQSLALLRCDQLPDARLMALLAGAAEAVAPATAAAAQAAAVSELAVSLRSRAVPPAAICRALLPLLASDNPNAAKAARLVTRTCQHSAEGRSAAAAAGCLPPLVALLLQAPEAAAADEAMTALRHLTTGWAYDDFRSQAVELGCLPPLLALLTGPSEASAVHAARLLATLSANCSEPMMAAGVVPAVLEVLSRPGASIVEPAVALLRQLIDGNLANRAAVAARCIPVLALLLRRADAVQASTELFAHLSRFHDVVDAIIDAELLPELIARLAAALESPSMRACSVKNMRVLARLGNDACCDAIMASGCVPKLATLLGEKGQLPEMAVSVLCRLAAGSDARSDAIAAAGCLPWLAGTLAAGLREQLTAMRTGAISYDLETYCGSVERLADGSAACRDAIVAAGCLKPLVALLENNGYFGPAEGLRALLRLAHSSGEHRHAIKEAGCLEQLAAMQRVASVSRQPGMIGEEMLRLIHELSAVLSQQAD